MCDVHVSGVLKLWLNCLTRFAPLSHPEIDEDGKRLARVWELLQELHAVNRVSILYTCRFLKLVCKTRFLHAFAHMHTHALTYTSRVYNATAI